MFAVKRIIAATALVLAASTMAQEINDNSPEGLAVLRELAARGDAAAHYRLGYLYFNGNRVLPASLAKSLLHYESAHELGHPRAEEALAYAYISANDYLLAERGARMLQKIYEQKPAAEVARHIGDHYAAKGGIDRPSAIEWYLEAAAQGDVDAQYNAAVLLLKPDIATGETGEDAARQAAGLLRGVLRSRRDDTDAINLLGTLYRSGVGVEQDDTAAYNLFSRAARMGNMAAAYNLAYAYNFGVGVKQNPQEALLWVGKARAAGIPEADELWALMCGDSAGGCTSTSASTEQASHAAQ